MPTAMVVINFPLYRHQPPIAVSFKRNTRRPDLCFRFVAGRKLINVPKQRFPGRLRQRFVFDQTATDAASLGRVFLAGRL
jgi:hypothetical protein